MAACLSEDNDDIEIVNAQTLSFQFQKNRKPSGVCKKKKKLSGACNMTTFTVIIHIFKTTNFDE